MWCSIVLYRWSSPVQPAPRELCQLAPGLGYSRYKAKQPQKVKILKLVRWGWIIAVAAFFISFVLSLICLALWFGAKWYFARELNARAKEIENARAEASANIRKKLEAQLKVN